MFGHLEAETFADALEVIWVDAALARQDARRPRPASAGFEAYGVIARLREGPGRLPECSTKVGGLAGGDAGDVLGSFAGSFSFVRPNPVDYPFCDGPVRMPSDLRDAVQFTGEHLGGLWDGCLELWVAGSAVVTRAWHM